MFFTVTVNEAVLLPARSVTSAGTVHRELWSAVIANFTSFVLAKPVSKVTVTVSPSVAVLFEGLSVMVENSLSIISILGKKMITDL